MSESVLQILILERPEKFYLPEDFWDLGTFKSKEFISMQSFFLKERDAIVNPHMINTWGKLVNRGCGGNIHLLSVGETRSPHFRHE
jgi:hypothetical protein